MSSFTGRIAVEITPKKVRGRVVFTLLECITYGVGSEDSPDRIRLEVGDSTDGLSVPLFARWIVPCVAYKTFPCGVLHDKLWRWRYAVKALGGKPDRSRKEVDDIFLESLRVRGVDRFTSRILWCAVRLQALWTRDK